MYIIISTCLNMCLFIIMKLNRYVFLCVVCVFRDRPAAIQIEVKSIDDTSNFDEFPDIDLKWRELYGSVSCLLISVHNCLSAVFNGFGYKTNSRRFC